MGIPKRLTHRNRVEMNGGSVTDQSPTDRHANDSLPTNFSRESAPGRNLKGLTAAQRKKCALELNKIQQALKVILPKAIVTQVLFQG